MTARALARPLLAALLLAAAVLPSVVQAASERPLLMPGKKALFQRVIAVPGAALAATRGGEADTPVTPFSVFYVYARERNGADEFLHVGTDSNGTLSGWLSASDAIDWRQTLTVGFKDPANQPRVMLFRNREALRELLAEPDADAWRALRARAEQGDIAGTPVVAIQPDYYIDVRRNFHLVPILEHKDAYRAGIVFVIDSTISMGPYITRTRETMARVYRELADAGLSGDVGFGLVAYRDNTDAVPGLEFVTRTYATLDEGTSGETFLARTSSVQPATVSSKDFNEDAYAGVKEAIQAMNWRDYYARYVVLITDAGPRVAGDPLATTGLDTESMRRLALDNGISVWVMHLKTPAGASDHAYAEKEYRRLSHVPEIGDFYYPVAAGDVDGFSRALDSMTEQLINQVRDTARGLPPLQVAAVSSDNPELAAFQNKAAKLGYALRMRYLSEDAGRSIPALFDAWMVDRTPEAPDDQAVNVRVLLTRDQLSDLHDVLQQVLLAAEEGAFTPGDFLNELRSLAATVSRDPEAASGATRTTGSASLADLGYMREYIDGLPYRSEVMELDLSTWQQWSAQQQFELINKLDGKVAYYRALHDNVDLWVSLDGGPVDGDSVYPLLLEALP